MALFIIIRMCNDLSQDRQKLISAGEAKSAYEIKAD
jgi:hypothetical protein